MHFSNDNYLMEKTTRSKFLIVIGLTILESLAALLWLNQVIGSAPEVFQRKISFNPALLQLFPLALIILFGFALFQLVKNTALSQKAIKWFDALNLPPFVGALLVLFILDLSALTIYGAQIGSYKVYYYKPLITILLLFLVKVEILFRLKSNHITNQSQKKVGSRWLVFSLIIILVLGLLQTNLQPVLDASFDSSIGAPIFLIQCLIVINAVVLVWVISKALSKKPGKLIILDYLLAFLIFIFAVALWSATPTPTNHYLHDSNLEEGVYFPYSDARDYDINAQFMLNGYGLAGGKALQRPLLSFFLGILHLLAGQNYSSVINAQILFYSLIPIGLYLLGKRINQREAGLMMALLFIFRETNQVVLSGQLTLSSVRLLMSELFMTIFLVMLTFIGSKWLQKPGSKTYALFTGLTLGLATLVRLQVVVLAPLIVLYLLILAINNKPALFRGLIWFSAGLLIIMVFWIGRNGIRSGEFIFENSSYFSYHLDRFGSLVNSEETIPEAPAAQPVGFFRQALAHATNSAFSSLYQFPWNLDFEQTIDPNKITDIENGFYPNLGLQLSEWVWIGIHTIFISLGIIKAYLKKSWIGLLPAGVYLFYNGFAAAMGFSGWRFTQPVDWVVLFYWSIGILGLIHRTANISMIQQADAESINNINIREWKTAPLILLSIMAGLFLPIGESLFSKLPAETDKGVLLESINISSKTTEVERLLTLASSDNAYVFEGKMMYPVYLEIERDFFLHKLQETEASGLRPVLAFDVFSGPNRYSFYLPITEKPGFIPHDLPIIVIGCPSDKHARAYGVYFQGDEPAWLLTNTNIPSQCQQD